jgi:hypothetical protein
MHSHAAVFVSLSLVSLLLVGGCATPYDIGNADARVTPTEAAKDVPGMLNHTVAWGGLIAVTRNLKDRTEIEVVAYPLDSQNAPDRHAAPTGRFIVVQTGYLETADFAPGRLITVVGTATESCGLLHGAGIFSVARQAVHLATLQQRRLRGGHVAFLPLPGRQHRRLQRPPVGEADLPRLRAHRVHGVQVVGGVLRALPAGQEHDAGHRRRHVAPQAAQRGLGHLSCTPACCGHFMPAITMFGLSSMPSNSTRWASSSANTASSTCEVTTSQRSMSWAPSMSTSGSTIGTSPISWHSAA